MRAWELAAAVNIGRIGLDSISSRIAGEGIAGLERISSRISEGTFRPPGNLFLRLILRHFRHEIRRCFAVSAVFRKRCLPVGFLLEQPPAAAAIKSGLDWIRFLVG